MDDLSDEELLRRWRADDVRAGEVLLKRHIQTARRHLLNRVENEDDVRDLINEAFRICVESKERVARFVPYLLGVLRRLVYKYWAERTRKLQHTNIEDCSIADLSSSLSSMSARSDQQRRILEALRRLPMAHQIALELYYWEHLSGHDLGVALGVPESTARSLLRRAKIGFGRAFRRMEQLDLVPETTDDDLDGWARRVRDLFTDRDSSEDDE